MQKPDIAANQQGSALSYLSGVLLGDGCVYQKKNGHGDKTRAIFHVKTIDSDFATEIMKRLRQYQPDIKIAKSIQKQHPTAKGKKPLHYVTTSGALAEYLREITHSKALVPTCAYKHPKDFLEGFLDSEGYVHVNHDPKTATIRLQIGIGNSSEFLHSIKKLFESFGVKTGKTQIQRLKSGKIFYRVRFNPQSFLKSGLKFHIERKQERLDAYLKAVDIMGGQRKKATFNDYKGELLKAAVPYYRRAAMV